MTREEAMKVLSRYDVNGVWADVDGKPYNAEEQAEAIDMAIYALRQVTGKLNNPDDSLLTADSEACKEQKSKLDLISRAEEFQRRLARSIAQTGKWLIDNAGGIAGTVERRRSLDIHLSWECSGNEIAPTINIDSDFICLEAIAEMHRKEIEK